MLNRKLVGFVRWLQRLAVAVSCCVLSPGVPPACAADHAAQSPSAHLRFRLEPISPVPHTALADGKRESLGERLFHDPRLSAAGDRSCASCHPLHQAAIDGHARGIALDGKARLRNTPTLFNVSLNASFNWDGALPTLEAHADRLIASPDVMGSSWPGLLDRLRDDASYVSAFRAAYSRDITRDNLLDALGAFQRSLLTPNARFDRFLRGESQAITVEEEVGYGLFKSYGCIACHQGVNIGGNLFQKFGVFQDPNTTLGPNQEVDTGRYLITQVDRDRGVFRVPSLRNVALTGPYFHDGRMPDLAGAVSVMARVQLGRSLTKQENDAIVSFLHTLTGEFRGQPLTVAPR